MGSILFDSSRDHNLALAHLAKALRRGVEIKLTLQRSSEPWAFDFVSYPEGVDTTTPTGQLLVRIVGARGSMWNKSENHDTKANGSVRSRKHWRCPFREVRLALAGGTGPDNISATAGN